jgi:uncharacterized protein YecE (DUF72 family)
MDDLTVVLAVTVGEKEQVRELMKLFNSIMYSIDHDPSIGAKWMSMSFGYGRDADPETLRFIGKLLPEELTYNDETLNKVREAITQWAPMGDKSVDSLISAFENAGILFRERESSSSENV